MTVDKTIHSTAGERTMVKRNLERILWDGPLYRVCLYLLSIYLSIYVYLRGFMTRYIDVLVDVHPD